MIIFFIFAGVLLRLIPHIPNFAPITGIGIFGGVYLKKRYALIIPLVTMLLSDYFLLYINPFSYPFIEFIKIYPITAMFHSTTLYVYISFELSGLIGIYLRNNRKPLNVLVASLLASIQFFLITNFGVWATGMYSRDLNGLINSYIMGIPFFRYTLLGDVFYTTTLFGIYELIVRVIRFELDY